MLISKVRPDLFVLTSGRIERIGDVFVIDQQLLQLVAFYFREQSVQIGPTSNFAVLSTITRPSWKGSIARATICRNRMMKRL